VPARLAALAPVLAATLVATASCDRIRGVVGAKADDPPPGTATPHVSTATPTLAPSAPAASATPRAAPKRLVRVYVAGESIERRVRWVERPFLADGRLNERGDLRNDDDEYGWTVPFAERLAIRAPDLGVRWVGAERWLGHDDEPYSGTFPTAEAGATSALSGTSIEAWLEKRKGELQRKEHCYDVAIAARGGNDFGSEDASVTSQLSELVRLLAAGSRCRPMALVVVTGHMPDDQRGGKGPDGKAYVEQQRHRFVERFRDTARKLEKEGLRVRFVDLYTPFVENRRTTAFPKEVWSNGGVPEYAKIGRVGDPMHPRRLASIYAGEILADAIDPSEL
jgi:hypothetical protein